MKQSADTNYTKLVRKATEAAITALESYNRPNAKYRDEAFCILLINAWELLLKARIILENNDSIDAVEVRVVPKPSEGKATKPVVKKGRSGTPITIGLEKCAEIVRQYPHKNIDQKVLWNLIGLIEIRDNAVHLMNHSPDVSNRVFSLGSAALLNFAKACRDWFDFDLREFGFAPLPVAFVPAKDLVALEPAPESGSNSDKLVKYLDSLSEGQEADSDDAFMVSVSVELRFVRGTQGAIPVSFTRDQTAPKVQFSEENILARFPYTFRTLANEIKKRHPEVKENAAFHKVIKQLKDDPNCCHFRSYNPTRPESSGRMPLFSQRCISEFEKLYGLTG